MPDGTLIRGVPDGMTQTELLARYQKSQGQPSIMDNYGTPTQRDVAKGAASGVATGLASTLGFGGDVSKMMGSPQNTLFPADTLGGKIEAAAGRLTDPLLGGELALGNPPMNTQDITKSMGVDYHPGTIPGKYAKEGLSGATAFLTSGGAGKAADLFKQALMGLGLGGVSETANQLSDPLGGAGANAAITAALAGIAAKKPRVVAATQDLINDVGETGLRQAAMKSAKASRVLDAPVVLTQGLDTPTGMTALTQDLMQFPGPGADARRAIEAQGPIGRSRVDDLIASLTGTPTDQTAANRVVAAGTTAVNAPHEAVTAMTKPFYEAAKSDVVPPEDVAKIVNALDKERRDLNLPLTSSSGGAMSTAAGKVEGTAEGYPTASGQQILGPDGKPLVRPTPVLNLDTLKREADKLALAADKPNATGADINQKLGQQGTAGVINEVTRNASDALATGQDLHKAGMEQLVQPVQQSALTTMFPQAMRDSGKGNWDVMLPVLEGKGSDITGDINKISSNLNSTDPNAFPTLVKKWLESKREAADQLVQGRENPNYFSSFVDSTAGSSGSNQRANFNEMIKGVARAQGQDPELAAKGASDLMDALQVVSRERAGLSRVNTEELQRSAGANPVTAATRMVSILRPFWSLGNAVERHVFGRTYEQVTQALTTPEGVDTLVNIAKYGSPDRIMGIAQALTRGNALQQGEQ